MRYRKISLINPPWDDDVFRPGYWQPLNLLALASYMKERGFTGDIQILDQAVLDSPKLLDELARFGPDLVGLSPNYYSYQHTLKIAEVAKLSGADVVLGGNYASHLASHIIHNRSDIDYVVVLDGEEPLLSLVQGLEPCEISNLVYRKGNQVMVNSIGSGIKATYCELDYSLVDLQPYFDNHLESRAPNVFERPIAFMSQRGCIWKDKTGGCIFCSRELNSRFDQVDDVWRREKDQRMVELCVGLTRRI